MNGPVSSTLTTGDIKGAQSSTKDKGSFSTRKRKDFRDINQTADIEGSQVGTLKKGPVTQRISNPLNPTYAVPGDIEYAGTTKHMMDRLGESNPLKPPRTNVKQAPGAEKKKHVTYQKPLNTDNLNKDRNTFYGFEGKGQEIDVNKLYQASKNPNPGQAPGVPPQTQKDQEFQYNQKKFYDQSVASKAELAEAQRKFYADTTGKEYDPIVNKRSQHYKKDNAAFYAASYKDSDNSSEKGSIFQENAENFYATSKHPRKEPVNKRSQHFKKSAAQFFEQSYAPSDKGSDRGSIFQNNAAEFYQTTQPKEGERPFKIHEGDLKDQAPNKGKSVLNEMKLKQHDHNMQRDPNYGKNLKRFWGMKSVSTVSGAGSYAQKLDQFLN